MIKLFCYIILFLVSTLTSFAQTINLEFPHFAGRTYDFTIFQGEKRITLVSDTIPLDGKVVLTIPPQYKGYSGVAQWYLTKSASGGGLDLIINNEDFSVSCLDSVPTNENIIYSHTIENTFDKINFNRQQKLFEKHDAMLATIRAYDKENEIYKIASKEYESLLNQYKIYTKFLNDSKLYAAKFRQIVNLTLGIGSIITLDENIKANDFNDFITKQLDFEVLYTSNHWSGIINNWIQLQTLIFKDDHKLMADTTTILERIKSDLIYTDFVTSLTKELTKAGKDDVLFALIPEIKNSKRLKHYEGVLNIFKQDLTGYAPDLVLDGSVDVKGVLIKDGRLIKTKNLNSKYSLLFFYKSGCGPCEATIDGLLNKFSLLTSKGLRIIAFSADSDEAEFKKTALLFPWNEAYCDFKGMHGVNFLNFAVIGTPTLYLLNSEGVILSKMSSVQDLLDWFEKN